MEYFSHGWGMGFGWLVPLLIIALIIYMMQNNKRSSSSSAQEILDRRFANGEIDEKEYKERSRLLKDEA